MNFLSFRLESKQNLEAKRLYFGAEICNINVTEDNGKYQILSRNVIQNKYKFTKYEVEK